MAAATDRADKQAMETNERNYLWSVATGHLTNGQQALDAGKIDEAWSEFERAEALIHRVREHAPEDRETLRDLSIAWEGLGDVAWEQGDTQMAVARYEPCLDIRTRLLTEGDARAARDAYLVNVRLAKAADMRGDHELTRARLEAARAALLSVAAELPQELARVEVYLSRMTAKGL